MADGKVVIETGLDSKGIEQGLNKLGGLVKTGLGAATKTVGAASAALTAAGGAAAKFGSDFESALAKASTLFGDVNVDTGNLSTKILELSNSSGVAASSIGESLYNALSAGIPATEDMGSAMTYMEECTKLAKAGFTDVDTAVTATAKVLNAYKMDVSETGKIHKILMQTQNKGITTVGELGAVLAQVTPTAAAMNVSFEQVGAALATMTAQGTPTAQATTQLNSLFAELGKQGTVASKSLEKATEGTKYAGKGFSELMAEGVPLNEILNLMGATADMSDQSLIDMFGSIEAGKAALAMSGKNAQQYTDNLEAMATETDLVGDAYEKVTNTFQAKSQVFIEGAKNLGIAIYKGMEEPLKGAADAGIGYVEDLTKAFQDGGLTGLVEEAGDIFADIVTEAAAQAPKVVDAAIGLIESFVKGIVSNKGQLAAAALDIAKTLAGGLSKLLPAEMQKPVQDAINAITRSFQSGGLKKAIDSAITLFKNLSKIVGNIAKVVLPILTKAVDVLAGNLDILVPAITAVTVALKAWKTAEKVSKLLDSINSTAKAGQLALAKYASSNGVAAMSMATANGAMTVQQTVLAGVTGKIGLATAAQNLFNAALSAAGGPIGLAVGALAALVAGIGAYKLLTDEGISSEKQLQKANEDLGNSWGVAGQAASDFLSGISSAGSIFDNFNDSIIVSNEKQQELSSKMDSVQGEITQIARTATEERRQLTQEEIDRLDELFQQMQELTAQELAIQQAYQSAVQSSAEALASSHEESAEEYAASSQKIINSAHETAQAVIDKAYEQMIETNAVNEQLIGTDAQYTQEWYNQQCAASQQRYQEAVNAAKAECNDTLAIVQQGYEQRATAGNEFLEKVKETNATAEAENARYNQALSSEEQRHNEEKKTSMFNMADATKRNLSNIEKINSEHNANMSSIYSSLTSNMTEEQAKQAGVWLGYVADAALYGGQMDESTKSTVDALIQNWDSLPDGCKDSLKYALQGAVDGFRDSEPELLNQAQSTSGNFLERLNSELGVASPSWKTQEMMGYVVEGAVNGLTAGTPTLITAGQTLMTSFMQALSGENTQAGATQMGMSVVNAIVTSLSSGGALVAGAALQLGTSAINALNGQQGSMRTAGTNLGTAAANGLRTANLSGSAAAIASSACAAFTGAINGRAGAALIAGTNLGRAVGNGLRAANIIVTATTLATQMTTTFLRIITSRTTQAQSAGRTLASAVGTGMQSAGLKTTANTVGSDAVAGLVGGIDNNKNKANEAGESLAKEAKNGLSGYGLYSKGHSTGSDFVSGFADGISANSYRAAAQAEAMARAAAAAANAALGIRSPSRVGHWIGEMFDRGTADGILDNIDMVEDAGSKLSESLLDRVDIQAAAQKMRLAVETESARIGILVSSKVNVSSLEDKKESAPITQTVNINQPVKSPIETAREIRRVGRELAFG